jgi:hypothetical protein
MTKKQNVDTTNEVSALYLPEPLELAAVRAYLAVKRKKPARPAVRVKEAGGKVNLELDHPNAAVANVLLRQVMGTTDKAFCDELLSQLANATGRGAVPSEAVVNFSLSVIEGIAPRDQVETMLAAHMALASTLAHADNIPQLDSAGRAFNKLARTFAVQMEALKRYRTGGEQRVTVQHVTVNDGGQAIVGTVTPAGPGGGSPENPAPTP